MTNPRRLPSSRSAASRPRRRPADLLVAAALACGLALPGLPTSPARADAPALMDTWRGPGSARPEFKKVLVVGITRNAPARRRFEDLFVSILRGRESQAITSYSLAPDLDNIPDPEKVVETLFAGQVDGVITVRLVSLDGRDEAQWGEAWRKELDEPVRIRPYVTDSLRRLAPDADLHGAEFALWDVQTGERLWAGRSGPVKVKKLKKSATDLVQDVMTELRFRALL
ncbi:MAG TPA: hypothetical protein VFD06_01520 [Candidatus Polarisedimenticolia bacterium]|nr:hypothetical protein [Candidatus Polarisedimenticolia bacterium]